MQEEADKQPYPELPGYKILSELGRGGIATVYLAVQESLDRQVALKVMSPLLAMEPDYAERFIREGRTVAQLSHSNIITVYDIGLQKHQLFIAMEHIPGGNMRNIMAQHQNDPEWALSIAGQIALALGYAHTVGIVHRDVKPENILFRENGSAVLTDFGIAKTISSNTNLTRAGTIIGTPKYMSPEQTDGLGNDPRTDVYSLGIILYEMLTGSVPFDSENSMAVLYAHVHTPVPDLPDELSDLQPLINNLLAKKVEDRSDDCDELAEIIRITRRERHYALKEPGRMQEAKQSNGNPPEAKPERKPAAVKQQIGKNIASYLDSLRNKIIPANSKPAQKNKNIKTLVILGLSAIILTSLYSIFSTDSLDPDKQSKTDQPLQDEPDVSQQVATDDKKVPPETALSGTTGNSKARNNSSAALSEIEIAPAAPSAENTAVKSGTGNTQAANYNPNQENQTQRLVSRFLADESHDELVKKHQAVAPVKKVKVRKPVVVSKKQREIRKLLEAANKAVQEVHITQPANANAVAYYKQVLVLSPKNKRALRGLDVSGDLIHEEAKEKYKAGKKDLALIQINNGLSLIPQHKNLTALKQVIEASFNPNSSFATAEKLYHGVGGKQDNTRAAFYYLKAAELGHIQAMNDIAVAYADGNGVPRDDRLAMQWFKKSAELKNSEAMYNLALGYHFSELSDPPKALPWVRQSAEAKYRPAYLLIGWMTTAGVGTRASRVGSIRWDLKGMVNPINETLHAQYRIPKDWQKAFIVKYKIATHAEK